MLGDSLYLWVPKNLLGLTIAKYFGGSDELFTWIVWWGIFFNFAVENFPLVCDRVMTDSAFSVGQQRA